MIRINKEDPDNIWEKAGEKLVEAIRSHESVLLFLSGGSAVKIYKKLAEYLLGSPRSFFGDSVISGSDEIFFKDAKRPTSLNESLPPNQRLGSKRTTRQTFSTFQKTHSSLEILGNSKQFLNLAIAQVDERFKPGQSAIIPGHSAVNAELIGEVGLWRICKEKGILYYLMDQKGTLDQSVSLYEKSIEHNLNKYRYKIAILGVGEDGHTAGLLPGYADHWDIDNLVVGYKNNGLYRQRISVTPKMIGQLDYALVVATGNKKKKALQKVLLPENKNNLDEYPGAVIQKIREVDLFTDVIIKL